MELVYVYKRKITSLPENKNNKTVTHENLQCKKIKG